jgi:hypothetical protein
MLACAAAVVAPGSIQQHVSSTLLHTPRPDWRGFFEPGPHSVKAGRLSSQKGKVTELRYGFMLPAGTAILNSDCTDMKIIDLLLNDFSVFGLRIQYWIPAVIGVFSAYGLFDWLDRKRHQKGNAGRAQCDAASNLSKGRNTLAS